MGLIHTISHSFTAKDLFAALPQKLLRGIWVKKRFKDRKVLAAKIFEDCFHMILLDIINNNVTFVLPLKFGNYGEISMKSFSEENFKEVYKKGKFNDLDYVLTQFTGNQLAFRYTKPGYDASEKLIYVDSSLKSLITKNTYEGKQYY